MSDGPLVPGGYIHIARKLFASDFLERPPWEFKLWCWMIAKANHAQKEQGQRLGRGELFTTIDEMREAVRHRVGYRQVKPGKSAVAKFLRRQREGNAITTTKTTRRIIISICNYDLYQSAASYERNRDSRAKGVRRTRESLHDRQECNNDNEKVRAAQEADLIVLKAEALVLLYKMEVQPPGKDDSPTRARLNVGKYLKEGQNFAKLSAAVLNYRDTIQARGTVPEFRKRSGNFFGREEKFFQDYLPENYAPTDAQTANTPTTTKDISDGRMLQEVLDASSTQ